jgi:hypothetical protein
MSNIFSENLTWSIGIIIGLFGIIAAHRLVSFRENRKSMISASSELMSVFAPSIARIDAAIKHVGNLDSPEVNEFLKENFENHSTAIEKFRRRIASKRDRKAFEEAWKEYCGLEPNEGGATLFAGHYAPEGKYLEFIKERIENILRFAKCN